MKTEKILHDLNVDNVMSEQWSPSDALRELISNALDEAYLTNTSRPLVTLNKTTLTIKDFGRGIKPENFINNENLEKAESLECIGQFGVGLKDALNILFNNNKEIKIYANNKLFKIEKNLKPNTVAHTLFVSEENLDEYEQGTKIILENITQDEFDNANKLFLVNCNYKKMFETNVGNIYEPGGKIFYKGVLVAENEDLAWTYNIIVPRNTLTKNFTRERKNLSKSAYSDSLSSIYTKLEKEDFLKWIKPYLDDRFKYQDSEIGERRAIEKYEKLSGGKLISQSEFDNLETAQQNKFIEDGFAVTLREGYKPESRNEVVGEMSILDFDKKSCDKVMKILSLLKENNLPSIDIKNVYVADEIWAGALGQASGLAIINKGKILLKKEIFNDIYTLTRVIVHECTHIKSGALDETRQFTSAIENNFEVLMRRFKLLDEI